MFSVLCMAFEDEDSRRLWLPASTAGGRFASMVPGGRFEAPTVEEAVEFIKKMDASAKITDASDDTDAVVEMEGDDRYYWVVKAI